MSFFSDLLGGVTGALSGGTIGGALASTALNSLFNKKPSQPEAPTASDISADRSALYGSINSLAPQVSYNKPNYGNVPFSILPSLSLDGPSAPGLSLFGGDKRSSDLLNQASSIFSDMAQGKDSGEFSSALNQEYNLAQQRGSQAVSDATRALDERLAARGIGRSGVAASQTRELQQRAGIDLASLANQIALANAQRKTEARTTGLQGLMNTSQIGFGNALNTYNTNQAATQQDFGNQLQLALSNLQAQQANRSAAQQSFENVFRTTTAQGEADRTASLDQFNRFSNIYSLANGGASPSQQNFQTSLAGYQNDLNAYNAGGQAIGGMVAANDPRQQGLVDIQKQLLTEQLNRLRSGNQELASLPGSGIMDSILGLFN